MVEREPEDVSAALRAAVTGNQLLEGDGIHPTDVVVRGQELLVVFQWQRDRAVYAFPVPLDDLSASPWTGEPVESPEEWADEVVWLLDEELMTGYLAGASRQLVDGRIELRQPPQPGDESDDRFDIADVEDPGLPALLAEAGLDVAEPVRLAAEGHLLDWQVMDLSTDGFVPVASVATSWDDATTARLVHLDTAPGLPVSAVLDLVHCAVSAAANSGATTLVSAIPVPSGEILGFRAAGNARFVLDTRMLDRDHAAMAALLQEERREQHNDPVGSTASRLADHVRRQRAGRGVTGDFRTYVTIEPNDDDEGHTCELDPPTRSPGGG
jgi:hypothetical protein